MLLQERRDAVPSVFRWTKISTDCQSSRNQRKLKRAESDKKALAVQWEKQATEKQKEKTLQEAENERNRVFTDLDIPICQEESVTTNMSSESVIHITEGADTDLQPDSETCGLGGHGNVKIAGGGDNQKVGVQSRTCDEQYELPYLCVERLKVSDKLVLFYTGLETFNVFMHAFWSLGQNVNHLNYAYSESCTALTPINQFLLMLVKLRRHYPHFELARMFKVSEFTVQNVFATWINFCYFQWKEVDWWPERSLVSHHCPLDFKKKFPSTRVIVDATEIHVKHPSNPRAQKASFSNYKHGNTMKVLIGVTPGGLTSFVSDAYGWFCK